MSVFSASVAAMKISCKRWFHPRSLVVSLHSSASRKMLRLTIGGKTQMLALVLLSTSSVFGAYSAGHYVAASTVVKAKADAVAASANIAASKLYSNTVPPSAVAPDADSERMKAQIIELQKKVDELKNTNQVIVQSVSAKANGNIGELESLIRKTGLSPSDLKKQAGGKNKTTKAEGGPFIPVDMNSYPKDSKKMLSSLDELNTLREIVKNLPLGKPIKNAELESPFGNRTDPFKNILGFHPGVDLAGKAGANIYSTADGKVIAAKRDASYGNMVDIDHGYGIVTRYGHMSKLLVSKGQYVKKGTIIGIQGQTGRATGPHLHYEVRYHDKPIDPQNFLKTGGSLKG